MPDKDFPAGWTASLSPELRRLAERFEAEAGKAGFADIVAAYSAKPKQSGRPTELQERWPMLLELARLLRDNPKAKPWGAARRVAQKHARNQTHASLANWLHSHYPSHKASLAEELKRESRPRPSPSSPPRFAGNAAPGPTGRDRLHRLIHATPDETMAICGQHALILRPPRVYESADLAAARACFDPDLGARKDAIAADARSLLPENPPGFP